MNVSGPWIRRPVMTTLVMSALLVFGLIAYQRLPVADLPSVDYPTITVTANLPGGSPETMAASVATPLEKQFSTIPGLDAITSTSQQGQTQITLQFDLDRDIDAAAADVQAALAQALRQLPRDIEPPTYRKVDPSAASILLYALTSPVLPLSALDEYAQTVIAQRLATVSGVAQVQVYGSQKYAVRILLDPQALAARQIGIDEVVRAVQAGNVNLPTGILWGTERTYAVEADGQLRSAAAFRPLVVAWRDGSPVRLQDLGRVVDSVQETKNAAWYNGTRGVVLAIQRQPGTNTVEVAERVRAAMREISAQLPPSLAINVLYDRSISIQESVRDVKFTLYLTLGLVVLVIFLFLRNLSATLIPSLTLPLAIVGTFAVMYLLDYSLDNLSLMALTLAVGFVVDDAIVMLENVVRHREMGKDRLRAALDGSAEIGFTIVSMTLSLVAVFIPILFLGGLIGRLFHAFAVTISAAILLSGVVSLTLTPMLCSRFLGAGHGSSRAAPRRGALGRWLALSEAAYQRSVAGYAASLRWVMARRRLTMLFSLGILGATVWLFLEVPKGFIPSEDQGQLRVTTETVEGTSFEGMVRHQLAAMQVIQADSNVAGFMSAVGSGGPSRTINQGRFIIRLTDREQRRLSADEVAEVLSRKLAQIPGLRAFVQNPPVINIGGRATKSLYQYTLQGADIDELYRAAERLEVRLAALPELRQVTTDLQIKNPEIRVTLDRERAAAAGVTVEQVQEALYNALGARQISTIYTDNNQYAVVLELLPQYQRDLSAMALLSIRSASGALVPLTALARVEETVGPLTVNHAGQLPAVTLSFDLAPGVAIGQAVAAVEQAAREVLPQTVTASFAGAAQAFQAAQQGLLILLVLAVLVIYLVLGILYESFVHPLTILSGVLFAGFGALLTLRIAGLDLSVYAFVGIVLLVGLVKKNAIMMVDFARERERAGKAAAEAIYEACLVRFRPIMMTTMAALMGTLPIALGHGAGAEARRPLGLAVVGGLAFSQLVTLYVTPVIHTYLDQARAWVESRRASRARARVGEVPVR